MGPALGKRTWQPGGPLKGGGPYEIQLVLQQKHFLDMRTVARLDYSHSNNSNVVEHHPKYFDIHQNMTEAAAQYLIDCDVKLVGIDSINVNDTRGKARPVHSLLLQAEILIVEHLCTLE